MGSFVAQTVQTISGVRPPAASGMAKEYKAGDRGPDVASQAGVCRR
jgi:hypothetical protein